MGTRLELNPTEGLWSSRKPWSWPTSLHRLWPRVSSRGIRGIERVRRTPHLTYSFLRHAGLSAS
jgi:hypothetical protein